MGIIKRIKDNRNLTIRIGLAILVFFIAIIILIIELNKFPMPNLEGLKPDEAKKILMECEVVDTSIKFSCNYEEINNLNVSKFVVSGQTPEPGERVLKDHNFTLELDDLNKCDDTLKKVEGLRLDKAINDINEFNKKASTNFSAMVINQDYQDITTKLQGENSKELSEWQVLSVEEVQLNKSKVSLSVDTLANIQKKKAEEDKKKAEEEAKREKAAAEENAKKEIESESNQDKTNSKININTASTLELQHLPGIGLKKAENIVDYRNTHGEFKSIEQITNVRGIGEKTFEKIKDLITI